MDKAFLSCLQDIQMILETQKEAIELLCENNRALVRDINECIEPFKKVGLLPVKDDPLYPSIQKKLNRLLIKETRPEDIMNALEIPNNTRSLRRVRDVMKHLGWKSRVRYYKEGKIYKRIWVCGH